MCTYDMKTCKARVWSQTWKDMEIITILALLVMVPVEWMTIWSGLLQGMVECQEQQLKMCSQILAIAHDVEQGLEKKNNN